MTKRNFSRVIPLLLIIAFSTAYIDSAANYGIGTNDPDQMEIVNIVNPSGTGETTTTPAVLQDPSRIVIVEDESASV